MNEYIALVLGVVLAGAGGELFVRGAVGLASLARISPGIIGATVAAFATSSPELSVSVNSALDGHSQIALGDALGSNIVNIMLILGITLLVSGIQTHQSSVKRDIPVAILIPIIMGIFLFDGEYSRIEGLLVLCLFIVWIVAVAYEAKKQRDFTEDTGDKHKKWHIAVSIIVGLVLLIAAGTLIVNGAKEIAVNLGIDEFIVGTTIVALGTSAPELATALIAKLRGHDEVGLGTVLGSNIFNGGFIVSVAAVINPIRVVWSEVAVTLVFGIAAVLLIYPPRNGCIKRSRGLLLLGLYFIYIIAVLKAGII